MPKIFSHSLGCVLILLIVSFDVQKVFNLCNHSCPCSQFLDIWIHVQKIIACAYNLYCFPIAQNFRLNIKSLNHFEFIIV
jgi:hypothetical protein